MRTTQVTIYSSPTPLGHIVRSGTETYQQRAAMWNTVTNLIRIIYSIISALATRDGKYYITADNRIYILRK